MLVKSHQSIVGSQITLPPHFPDPVVEIYRCKNMVAMQDQVARKLRDELLKQNGNISFNTTTRGNSRPILWSTMAMISTTFRRARLLLRTETSLNTTHPQGKRKDDEPNQARRRQG